MRPPLLRAALVALPLVLASQAFAGDASIGRGRAIARENCGRCHAIGPTGASPNPKSPPFRHLAERYPLADLEEALAEGILVGHQGTDMPRFEFSPRQIEALLAYLNSIQRKR